jgi:hypothetical protein
MYEPGFFASNQKTSLRISFLGSTTTMRNELVPVPFVVVNEQSTINLVPRLPVTGETPKLVNLASPWSLTTNTRYQSNIRTLNMKKCFLTRTHFGNFTIINRIDIKDNQRFDEFVNTICFTDYIANITDHFGTSFISDNAA